MAGVSGPGVGLDSSEVHAGGVGTMMFVGKTKSMSGVDVLADEHAGIKERRKMKDRMVLNMEGFMVVIVDSPYAISFDYGGGDPSSKSKVP